jgi:hypothetical protein
MTGTPLRDLEPWIHPSLYVDTSAVHGRGVFTAHGLPLGSSVVRFGGFLFGVARRYDFDVVARGSVIGLSDEVVLAEQESMDFDQSDFINHSCAPNLGMVDAITLVTTRRIDRDEELTADYGFWEADEDYVMRSRCNCGQQACRSRVTGRDWSLPLEHLRAWAAPFIRRRIAGQLERNAL